MQLCTSIYIDWLEHSKVRDQFARSLYEKTARTRVVSQEGGRRNRMAMFLSLPPEILLAVLEWLDVPDLVALSRVRDPYSSTHCFKPSLLSHHPLFPCLRSVYCMLSPGSGDGGKPSC